MYICIAVEQWRKYKYLKFSFKLFNLIQKKKIKRITQKSSISVEKYGIEFAIHYFLKNRTSASPTRP